MAIRFDRIKKAQAGHTILAIPGFGGVRQEDVYRVGSVGSEMLFPYPGSTEILGESLLKTRG